ncbi:MAG: ferredoxin [Oscillospiraceae bacterium]|nr:ferredoxin [Oscillospiraceae bacterium]
MKITIDREGCISCGLCISLCPGVFRFADDGLSEVYRQPDSAQEENAKIAADSCPVDVIHAE